MFSANSLIFQQNSSNEFENNHSSSESSEDFVLLKIPFIGNLSFEFYKNTDRLKKFNKSIELYFLRSNSDSVSP